VCVLLCVLQMGHLQAMMPVPRSVMNSAMPHLLMQFLYIWYTFSIIVCVCVLLCVLQMGHLRAKMPAMFGKEKAQRKIMENLTEHFVQVFVCRVLCVRALESLGKGISWCVYEERACEDGQG